MHIEPQATANLLWKQVRETPKHPDNFSMIVFLDKSPIHFLVIWVFLYLAFFWEYIIGSPNN